MYEIELDPEVMESVRMISKQLEEMSQRMVKFAQNITVQISPVMEQLNYTMQAIQDTIPNIRCFQESFRPEMLEFAKNMTSLMQTLDFPVVQPEITKEQLKNRLENMDTETFEKACTEAEKVVKTSNLSQKKKKPALNALKSSCRDVVIGVIIEIIASTLIAAVHPQQTSENVVRNYITNNYYPPIATESTKITDSRTTEN